MKKYRITFSPTGGTEKAAKAITKEWDQVEDIDLSIADKDYAVKAGFDVIAAIAAVAEHSILHQYATGRPDKNDCDKLAEFGTQILGKAEKNDTSKPSVPGNRPYKKSGAGMIPKADHSCTACGLCADKCPAGAIDKSNPQITDKSKCISCMRCAAICPKHARKVSGFMTAVAGMAIKKVG